MFEELSKKLHAKGNASSPPSSPLPRTSEDPHAEVEGGPRTPIQRDDSIKKSMSSSRRSVSSNLLRLSSLSKSQSYRSSHPPVSSPIEGNTTSMSFPTADELSPGGLASGPQDLDDSVLGNRTMLRRSTSLKGNRNSQILASNRNSLLSNHNSLLSANGSGRTFGPEELTDFEFLDDEDDKDSYVEPEDFESDTWSHQGSTMMVEAVGDTPAFRASIEYLDLQFKSLERWLFELSAASKEISTQIKVVKDSVNQMIRLFMPSSTHSSILAHDYTTLLFGRYTEAESAFWTDLIAMILRNTAEIQQMVMEVDKGPMAKYNELRRDYLQALLELDKTSSMMMRLPDRSEPAALRDATIAHYRAKRAFLKVSTRLVVGISELEGELTVSLVSTLSHRFLDVPARFQSMDLDSLEMSSEFHRLKKVADHLKSSIPALKRELNSLRISLVKGRRMDRPATALKAYRSQELPLLNECITEKTGWVNVEVKPGVRVVLWAYLINGLFGLMGTSRDGTSVVESLRFPVHACEFELIRTDEHPFQFRVTSSGQSILAQVTDKLELAQWKSAFSAASASFEHRMSQSANAHQGNDLDGGKEPVNSHDISARELLPWCLQFAVPDISHDVAPGSEAVIARIKEIRRDVSSPHWLRYGSTLTCRENSAMGITVPSVKPIPTSASLEAVVANSYFKPFGVPNAISGNIWGCLSSMTNLRAHNNERELAHYDGHFPKYPSNYPRGIVVQDMDMRSVISQLPSDEKLRNDDFLLFFIRATMQIRGSDVPVRMYVTSEKLIVYSSWLGLVYLQSFNIESVLDIEAIHGVDYSELDITVQNSDVSEEGTVSLRFKLYIDSSELVKQQLDLVLKNRRSREPQLSHELIEPLSLMRVAYASEIKHSENRMESDLLTGSSSAGLQKSDLHSNSVEPGGDATHPENTADPPSHKPTGTHHHNVATWLLRRAMFQHKSVQKPEAQGQGNGMQLKLAEDTFPLGARAVFSVMFGPRSPVFTGHLSGFLESENEAGPWYRRGRKVERRIVHNMHLGSYISTSKRSSYQRIERQERDMFVVSERLSSWELPRGDQFYTIMRYILYNTEQGSHLQVWGRVIWQKVYNTGASDDAIRPLNKLFAQAILMRVREAGSRIHSLEEAHTMYGKVRPVKILKSPPKDDSDEMHQVTKVTGRTMALIMTRSPIKISRRRLKWVLLNMFYRLLRISSPTVIITLLLLASLLFNFRLYGQAKESFWLARFDNEEIKHTVDTLKMSMDPSSMVFTRAIYLKDIDDMIADGALWYSPENIVSESIDDIDYANTSQGCARRFSELARASTDVTAIASYPEPQVQDAIDRISAIRLEFATRRNELLTMMRILNLKERETLTEQYRQWLITEANMCSRARTSLEALNTTVRDQVKRYCVVCLEEAKQFL